MCCLSNFPPKNSPSLMPTARKEKLEKHLQMMILMLIILMLEIQVKKPCRPKAWVWDHFTRDASGTQTKCKWCVKLYVVDSHKNGTTSINYHFLHQCKKIPRSVLDHTQTTLSLQEGGKETINVLVDVHFYVELCRQTLARMIIVEQLLFLFVENEEFYHFINVTQPMLPLPRRISIASDFLSL